MVGTQAGGVNRTVAPTQRFCDSRQGYQRRRRSNGRSGRRRQDPGLAGARVGVIGSRYGWRSPPFPRYPELLCPDLGPPRSDIAQIRLRGSADVEEGGSLVTSIQEALEDLRMGHGDPGDSQRRSPCPRPPARSSHPRGTATRSRRASARPTASHGARTPHPARASRTSRTQPLALIPYEAIECTLQQFERRGRSHRRARPDVVLRCIGSRQVRSRHSTAWSSTRSRPRSSSRPTPAGSQLRDLMLDRPGPGASPARVLGLTR